MERNKWDQIYHFTSLKNLERIARTGYIALTDVTKSNDPSEGIYVLETLKQSYQKLWRDGEITEKQYLRFHQLFFDFVENEKTGRRLQQMVLSLSFCEPDIPLALWRAYGDQGRGAAIGIAKEKLEQIGQKRGFRFQQVQYYDEKELIYRQQEFWRTHLGDTDESLQAALREQYICGYFTKREENSYEKEWRLIYAGFSMKNYNMPGLEPEMPEELDAYAKADALVFYYKLPVNQERLIEHIRLGPQCKAKACEMLAFLKRYHIPNMGVTYAPEIMG